MKWLHLIDKQNEKSNNGYDDRKTIYLIAKNLGYMFVKIKDVDLDPKKNQTLSLEKILSLG